MKNENGVYTDYQTETVAERGRSYARILIARCEDGLYRFALDMQHSHGGFGGPITDRTPGVETYEQAKTAGMAKLLERFPKAWDFKPQSVHEELKDMRQQVEAQLRQPSLF